MQIAIGKSYLFFTDSGNAATAVVFLHAFPLSHRMWHPQVEALASEYRVITYDVRGHGQSDVGDGQYTVELLVDDLAALLQETGMRRAVLCGLSMGGYIALRFAERHADKLAGLVLADTKSDADTNEEKIKRAETIAAIKEKGVSAFAEIFLAKALSPQSLVQPPLVSYLKKMIEGNSPIGLCGALLAMAGRTDTTAVLSTLKVPTLFLAGENDTITPPSLVEAMSRRVAGSEFKVIRGTGHYSNVESPEEFNEALRQFLSRVAL